MANKNLTEAKKAKNDEFYTQLGDIENELKHYEEHLKDKVVYINCDDPSFSKFWTYFKDNFDRLELKKVIATYYDEDNVVVKHEIVRDEDYKD